MSEGFSQIDQAFAYRVAELFNKNHLHPEHFRGDVRKWYRNSIQKVTEELGLSDIELVAEQSDANSPIFSGGGDANQGWEGSCFVVLRLGDRYLRAKGDVDSYGEETWGTFLELVQPVTKTITAFE
jgi:hypothetical protein